MASIWTTKTRRPQDYVLAEEPDGAYPPAMRTQADRLEAKIVAQLGKQKAAAKPKRKAIQA